MKANSDWHSSNPQSICFYPTALLRLKKKKISENAPHVYNELSMATFCHLIRSHNNLTKSCMHVT